MSEQAIAAERVVIERPDAARGLSWALGLGGYALALAGFAWFPQSLLIGLGPLALTLALLVRVLPFARNRLFEAARVEWRGRRLRIAAQPVTELDIAQGMLASDGAILETADGTLVHVEASPEDAARLIEGLDVGVSARRARARWTSWAAWLLWALTAGTAGAVAIGAATAISPRLVPFAVPLAFVAAALLARSQARRDLTIGADGIDVAGPSGRFFAYADLESVEHREADVVLTMRSGERFVFPSDGEPALRSAIARRIDDAFTQARRREHDRGTAAQLGRGAETVAAWRARLLATDGASFRVSSTSNDDIAAVLDDPSAPSEARIGAALALAGDSVRRPKIRVAAEVTAEPALRKALARVDAGTLDDASLPRAESASARGSVRR